MIKNWTHAYHFHTRIRSQSSQIADENYTWKRVDSWGIEILLDKCLAKHILKQWLQSQVPIITITHMTFIRCHCLKTFIISPGIDRVKHYLRYHKQSPKSTCILFCIVCHIFFFFGIYLIKTQENVKIRKRKFQFTTYWIAVKTLLSYCSKFSFILLMYDLRIS